MKLTKKEIENELIKMYQNDSLVETINIGGRPNGRYALDYLALHNQKIAERLIHALGGTLNEDDRTPIQREFNRKFGDGQSDDVKNWDWSNRPQPYFSEYDKHGNTKPRDDE